MWKWLIPDSISKWFNENPSGSSVRSFCQSVRPVIFKDKSGKIFLKFENAENFSFTHRLQVTELDFSEIPQEDLAPFVAGIKLGSQLTLEKIVGLTRAEIKYLTTTIVDPKLDRMFEDVINDCQLEVAV